MRSNERLSVMTLFVLGASGSALASIALGESFIVRDGQPQAEMMIAEKPARMTKLAAGELQTYIARITGAKLPITTKPSKDAPVRIHVGKSAHTDRLKLSVEGLTHGAFRMASGESWLALLGPDKDFTPVEPWGRSRSPADTERMNRAWDEVTGETFYNPFHSLYMYYMPSLEVWAFDDRGTLHAVHEFLRSLGVRWYFPGELGEVVPKTQSIALPNVNRTVRPDFAVRNLVWFYQFLSTSDEDLLWRLRLGLHNGHDVVGITQSVHGMKYVHRRTEMKKAHPEYYAIWRGKRATDHKDSGAPCLSSEGLFQRHVKYVRAVFDHFGEPMVSIDPVDGYSAQVCECDLCKDKGTPERGQDGAMSDYVWGYVNRVAQEVYKTHPNRMVCGLSYGAYRLPPEKIDKLSPNLALRISPRRMSFHDREARKQFEQLLQAWLAKLRSKAVFTADRFLYNWPRTAETGLPVYYPHLVAEDLRSLKGVSMGEMVECYEHRRPDEYPWDAVAVTHLGIYVTSRLWWDADQDVDTLLEEYYTGLYGPARKEMKAFIEFSEANWPRMAKEVEPIDTALKLLAAARKAAGDTVYGKRIDRLVECLKPMHQLRARLAKGRENVTEARALRRSRADFKLDGKLDDAFWPERRFSLSDVETGRPPKHGAAFCVAWGDDDALYVGIRCEEPDTKNLNATATKKDDEGILKGDVIELLIETQVHSYYRIAVAPSGAALDADLKDARVNTRWSSGAEVASHIGDGFWSVEVRLPAAGDTAHEDDPQNGLAGRTPSITYPWHLNVCRRRVRGDTTELSAWSSTGKRDFHDVRKFGMVWVK